MAVCEAVCENLAKGPPSERIDMANAICSGSHVHLPEMV